MKRNSNEIAVRMFKTQIFYLLHLPLSPFLYLFFANTSMYLLPTSTPKFLEEKLNLKMNVQCSHGSSEKVQTHTRKAYSTD